jgi:hypothetical protein
MHIVKPLCLSARQMDQPHTADMQSATLDSFYDIAGIVTPDRIRLDNRKGKFHFELKTA